MKQSFGAYFAMRASLLLVFNINALWGSPLTRLITDYMMDKADSSTVGHPQNVGLSSSVWSTHQVNSASRRFPSHPIPTNGMAATKKDDTILSRSRREADDTDCTVTNDALVVQASDLDTFLNATTFLGLNPDLQERLTIPSNQPNTCPSTSDNWWPGTVDNLKSTCPWKWVIKDLSDQHEPNVYPRFVRVARCLCQSCVDNDVLGCSKLTQPINIFQKIGCVHGLAVMVKKSVDITVGCYCRDTRMDPQSSQTHGFIDEITLSP